MTRWIALLRGINVGGKHLVPMATLRADLEGLGLANVRTYIQSGNVVFDAAKGPSTSLEKTIAGRIEERHGFAPRVLVLTKEQLDAAVDANPFPEAASEPKSLHFNFLTGGAEGADLGELDELLAADERYALIENVLFFHAPQGIGRSKAAARLEKLVGVEMTARNLRTVLKLQEMAAR